MITKIQAKVSDKQLIRNQQIQFVITFTFYYRAYFIHSTIRHISDLTERSIDDIFCPHNLYPHYHLK